MSPLTRRQFIGATAGLVVVGSTLATSAQALSINPRSSWGSDLPPTGPLSAEDVRFLLVHHSASNNGHASADAPEILRSWYRFHTGPEKGWPDIAYNFIIDSEGVVWEGRAGSLEGAVAGSATGGNQGFTQLVCVIGDTNVAPATASAQASLVQVLAWLADRHGVSTASGAEVTFTSRGSNRWPEGTLVTTPTIAGHRDMSRTTCPGDDLYGYVTGSLRADVESARGGIVSAPTTTAATSTTVAPNTTIAPTTTVAPTTTAVPASTTTLAPTTTAGPASSTTSAPITTTVGANSTTTVRPVTTTVSQQTTVAPQAVAELSGESGVAMGLAATAGTMLAAGLGLLLWRWRRMGGPRA